MGSPCAAGNGVFFLSSLFFCIYSLSLFVFFCVCNDFFRFLQKTYVYFFSNFFLFLSIFEAGVLNLFSIFICYLENYFLLLLLLFSRTNINRVCIHIFLILADELEKGKNKMKVCSVYKRASSGGSVRDRLQYTH